MKLRLFKLLYPVFLVGCVIPDMVIFTDPPVVDPPLPNSTLYEQTWEFGQVDQLQLIEDDTIDNSIVILREGTIEFYWDRTIEGIDPTGASSIKITQNETGLCCGVEITIPNAYQEMSQKIWHEQWIKYDPYWTVATMNNCTVQEQFNLHSTIWWKSNESNLGRDQAVIGTWRDAELFLSQRKADGRPGGFTIGHLSMANEIYNPSSINLWNGEWHRLRFYISRAEPSKVQGWYTIWFDDRIVYNSPGWLVSTGEDLTWEGNIPYWNVVNLSDRMWCVPPAPQSIWFGRTTIYNKDPGWN